MIETLYRFDKLKGGSVSPIVHATTAGTTRYRDRLADDIAEGHFREVQGCWMSSIGLGTYLGEYDQDTDRRYQDAIERAIALGCNVIDSASNYRFQRSERAIGEALKLLQSADKLQREEVVVATKGGYIPFDGAPPKDVGRYYRETFFDPGIIMPEELVGGGSHCLSPRYIQHQLDSSLKNLGLSSIDVYYLHNPEQQLDEVSREEFNCRMRAAFELLEQNADIGKIQFYGTATWNGYRLAPMAMGYLSLPDLVSLARSVGGVDHRFRFVQLPINLAMPEAITVRNQRFDGEIISLVEACARLGVTVMASASIMQGRLARNLPMSIARGLEGLRTDAQRSIQFVRSTPGVAVALVGMSQVGHVEENLEVARVPPASLEKFMTLFSESEGR